MPLPSATGELPSVPALLGLGARVVQRRPDRGHQATITLPGFTLDSVSAARRFVSDSATSWAVPRTVTSDLVQIVSELAANAVEHSPGLRMTVAVALMPRAATVSVIDSGPVRPLHANAPSNTEVRGRGLAMVEALAEQWGHMILTDGNRVWARVPIPPQDVPQDVPQRAAFSGTVE